MSDQSGNPSEGQPTEPYGQSQGQPSAYPPPSSQPSPYGQSGQPPQGQPEPQPYGQQPYPTYGQPAYGQSAYGQSYADPGRRPATVTAAAVTTIVMSGLMLALFLFLVVGLLVARGPILDQMSGQPGMEDFGGMDAESVFGVAAVVSGGFALWCVIAIVLAVFAMRRSNGARIALVVSSVVAGLLSLLAIGSGISVVPLAACIAVVVCLFVGGAGPWYAGHPARSTGQAGPIA